MNATASRLIDIWHRATHSTLDAIFPPRCAGCGVWHKELFCGVCRAALRRIEPPLCAICGVPFDPLAKSDSECAACRANRYHVAPPFVALRAVYAFEGPVRKAIHRFKYHDKTALAKPLATVL